MLDPTSYYFSGSENLAKAAPHPKLLILGLDSGDSLLTRILTSVTCHQDLAFHPLPFWRSLFCVEPLSRIVATPCLPNFRQEGKSIVAQWALPRVCVYDLSTIEYFIGVYGTSLKTLEQEHCGTSEETSAINRSSKLWNAVNV